VLITRVCLVVATAGASISALAPVADAQPRASTSSAQVVAVTLKEFEIVMPRKLRPGLTTFVLHNRGRFPHNFTAIYGPTRFHSPNIPPAATARLTVTLAPGAYLVACTILNGGHLAQGMYTLFTIGTRNHGSGAWQYP
jgi:hypothetical protein